MMAGKVQVADPWRSMTRSFNNSGTQFLERKNMELYWPGTKIVKSNGNAFTSWKVGKESMMANDLSHKKAASARAGRKLTEKLPVTLHITKKKA